MPPARFGKYELLAKLARGGMAQTYRAQMRGEAGVVKPVVIKRVLSAYADDKKFVESFIQEARISATLSHSNIAQVFDFGRAEGEYFLAMEFVHGTDLGQVLKAARAKGFWHLPMAVASFVALEMAKGLHYAHTRLGPDMRPLDLVHRDVSPENVLISWEGEVKLIDFGVAKARLAGRNQTEAGTVKGKYSYFSPEQARGEEIDGRTDIFATGVVLYRMLGGRNPFEGGMHKALYNLARGQYTPLSTLNPGIPADLVSVVERAMALDLNGRFPDAAALADALSAFLHRELATFSARDVAHFMQYLFDERLEREGISRNLPARYSELIAQLRPSPRPDEPESSLPPTSAGSSRSRPGSGSQPGGTLGLSASQMREKPWRWWLLAAALVPIAAVVLGVVGWELRSPADPTPPVPAPVAVEPSSAGAAEGAEEPPAAQPPPVRVRDRFTVADAVIPVSKDHLLRFAQDNDLVHFKIPEDRVKRVETSLSAGSAFPLLYATFSPDGKVTGAGEVTRPMTVSGPARLRLFTLRASGPGELAMPRLDGVRLNLRYPALIEGVTANYRVVDGLKAAGRYRIKVRGPGEVGLVVLNDGKDARQARRQWAAGGEAFELGELTTLGFAFLDGSAAQDVEVLVGMSEGPADISTAEAACQRAAELEPSDAEAASYAKLTCALLGPAQKRLEEADERERKAQAETERRIGEDMLAQEAVGKAAELASAGQTPEAAALLKDCAKKFARSCRCIQAWGNLGYGTEPSRSKSWETKRLAVCTALPGRQEEASSTKTLKLDLGALKDVPGLDFQ
ncbi:MAG: serine/threonine protein kinase [Myxococcaceae bacterium]